MIKLDSVVTDILGVSARQMSEALIVGVRDAEALARLARTSMRPKIPLLRRALDGRFGAHHALMLRMHLDHVDQLSAAIERLDIKVDRVIRPFRERLRRLITIPGVGRRTAGVIIAEIGVDMSRFRTAGHLASWAGMCPGNHESAHKSRSGRARKGDSPCGQRYAKPPGPPPAPRTATSQPSTATSCAASAPKEKPKPPSPSATPS